jgi:arabinose-5-phosphate isomerase
MIERVRNILKAEADAISAIPLGAAVEQAVQALLSCKGKVFTTGIGKAGYVAKKAASTFSTTGTPSAFIHPGDAPHGDIGVVADGDVLIGYSNSGKTREIIETVHLCRKLGAAKVISVISTKDSPLGNESDIVLEIGPIIEPCPLGFTPSASTTAMMALSDALALVVMEQRGFSKEDFAVRHHGGYLGRKSRDEEA